uniref:Uncharacterized protein n=1 Tax=Cucumis melo TaxID=3656 RepID=A0A9I9CD22_CUCME
MGDGECAYNNSSDRVGGSIVGLGDSAARLGGWTGCVGGLLYDYIFNSNSFG